MSYDLMVFEPEEVPLEHQAFIRWYTTFMEWDGGRIYDDPSIASTRLQSWLSEIRKTFPDMNSPEAEVLLEDADDSLSDYSIGKEAIYACFAWSRAEKAYALVFELAAKHGVGFFDVSSPNEEVWLPQTASLKLASQKKGITFRERIGRLFLPKR